LVPVDVYLGKVGWKMNCIEHNNVLFAHFGGKHDPQFSTILGVVFLSY
jgi:hypothetical protein